MQEQREDRAKAQEEAVKRMEQTQPTPTQEENDLAKLGVVVEEKEDDKSGPTVITHTVLPTNHSAHGYESRRRARLAKPMSRRRNSISRRRNREPRLARRNRQTPSRAMKPGRQGPENSANLRPAHSVHEGA